MIEFLQPQYQANPPTCCLPKPPRNAVLPEHKTPDHPYAGFRVSCGNGHPMFTRYFADRAEAHESAYFHNMFKHNQIGLGFGLADVDRVFVNIPF